jgi:ATP-dependent helicase/nuclease subunit B
LSIARRRFTALPADPDFSALNWPNVEKSLDFVLDFERRSRDAATRVSVEQRGEILVPLNVGASFKLTARADRIDVLRSGRARIIDYKSGTPPGTKEVEVGFAPQLTLEAAMLRQGGFKNLPPLEVESALYLKLGGQAGGKEIRAGGETADIRKLADKHFAELKKLLDQFAREETPYLARPFPKFASRYSNYDHLARVKEWSATAGEGDASDAQ